MKVELIVPIPIVPIDKIRQAIVSDFLNPILSANIPQKRALIMKRNPYIAEIAPASAFEMPKPLSTSTKTRGRVEAAVAEMNRELNPPVAQIQP